MRNHKLFVCLKLTMTSDRTYKEKITSEEALKEIKRCSGTQFDPELVKVFVEHFVKIVE